MSSKAPFVLKFKGQSHSPPSPCSFSRLGRELIRFKRWSDVGVVCVPGNKAFSPFSSISDRSALISLWSAVTKVSPFLEEGSECGSRCLLRLDDGQDGGRRTGKKTGSARRRQPRRIISTRIFWRLHD